MKFIRGHKGEREVRGKDFFTLTINIGRLPIFLIIFLSKKSVKPPKIYRIILKKQVFTLTNRGIVPIKYTE